MLDFKITHHPGDPLPFHLSGPDGILRYASIGEARAAARGMKRGSALAAPKPRKPHRTARAKAARANRDANRDTDVSTVDDVGSLPARHTFTARQVARLVYQLYCELGTYERVAERIGTQATTVNDFVLGKHYAPNRAMLEHFGLEKVTVYRKKTGTRATTGATQEIK